MMKPRCCTPGITARASNPTMKPTIMYQMMCNIGFVFVRPQRLTRWSTRRRSFSRVAAPAESLIANHESLITLRVFATKLSHRQCPTSARGSVRRLGSVVTSFEAPFF